VRRFEFLRQDASNHEVPSDLGLRVRDMFFRELVAGADEGSESVDDGLLKSGVGLGLYKVLSCACEEVVLPNSALRALKQMVECLDVVAVWARLVFIFRYFESGVGG